MTQTSSKIMIRRSVDAVWEVISDFGAADQYRLDVARCTTTGQGVGTHRTLTGYDGSTIVERLETLDETARSLSYTLLTDTPFGNCITTMALSNLGPYQTELSWSANFQPIGLPESEALDLLRGAVAESCIALKQFLER